MLPLMRNTPSAPLGTEARTPRCGGYRWLFMYWMAAAGRSVVVGGSGQAGCGSPGRWRWQRDPRGLGVRCGPTLGKRAHKKRDEGAAGEEGDRKDEGGGAGGRCARCFLAYHPCLFFMAVHNSTSTPDTSNVALLVMALTRRVGPERLPNLAAGCDAVFLRRYWQKNACVGARARARTRE